MKKSFLMVRSTDSLILGCLEQDDPDAGPTIPQAQAPEGYTLVEDTEGFTRSGRSSTEAAYLIDGTVSWVETAQLSALKANKSAEINQWRSAETYTSFPYAGKMIACDPLSRSDIDGVASHIGLFSGFPAGFPMAWKAMDNTYVMLPDIEAFKSMYAAMTAQGVANFTQAQKLKAQLEAATTPEQIAAIQW